MIIQGITGRGNIYEWEMCMENRSMDLKKELRCQEVMKPN
jgi:hypothetical protein